MSQIISSERENIIFTPFSVFLKPDRHLKTDVRCFLLLHLHMTNVSNNCQRNYSLIFKPSLILPKNKTHLIYNCSMCEKRGKSRVAVYLFLQLVEDKFDDDIILKSKDLCHTLGDPGLDDFQVDLGHIHLKTHQKTTMNNRIFHIFLGSTFI